MVGEFASVTAGVGVGVGDGDGGGVGVRRGVGLGLGDGMGVGVGVSVGVGDGDGNGTGVCTGGGVRCVTAACCLTDGLAPGRGSENSIAPSAQMPSSQTRAATPICTSGREPPSPASCGRAGTLVRGRA
jgi:hypothetical protein